MTDLTIDAGATLVLDGAFDGVVTFTGGASTLRLNDLRHFTGTIAGLEADDTIYIPDTAIQALLNVEDWITHTEIVGSFAAGSDRIDLAAIDADAGTAADDGFALSARPAFHVTPASCGSSLSMATRWSRVTSPVTAGPISRSCWPARIRSVRAISSCRQPFAFAGRRTAMAGTSSMPRP
jgi:hypothetical protein